MAIPQLSKEDILKAFEYIDINGIPIQNKSTKYELVLDNGNKYPPKYVIAVATRLATGNEVKTDDYNAVEAKNFFETRGYNIAMKDENELKYELIITAEDVVSNNESFQKDNLELGDNYRPLDALYRKADGTVIKRKYYKGENKISNQTLPRLACQIFEEKLRSLSRSEREHFPVCQYSPTTPVICGIFDTPEELQKSRNSKSIEYLIYRSELGFRFVMYSWNIFSTIVFVQECLRRYGDKGDQFILYYRDKSEAESKKEKESEEIVKEEETHKGYRNDFSNTLLQSKNIIFRGAPGTGKTYLAREIAADIVSDGLYDNYESLSDEQKEQIEFVQFHPSYDYSDFVEGLRPVMKADGSMGFELQDGIFTSFVKKAIKNYEYATKNEDELLKEASSLEIISEFLKSIQFENEEFKTVSGNKFYITDVNDKTIKLYIPNNDLVKELSVSINDLKRIIESGREFDKISDITSFFGKNYATQGYSYVFALYKEIQKRNYKIQSKDICQEKLKKYIFIIDEINRGEISKILGELFFSIDPGYRGKEGSVSTQYSNMHEDKNEKFYIPENVYIIGTMNDIDRSVDSFDFAMRRRFRFIEVKAEDSQGMLESLGEALKEDAERRMNALNEAIVKVEDLNENYQIGAAYFLKLKYMNPEELWKDCIEPLLKDYVRGMYDEDKIMNDFAKAYGIIKSSDNNEGELSENQG